MLGSWNSLNLGVYFGTQIIGLNRDLYINLNFTLILKVFLMGPWGPQGVINYPQGPEGKKKWGREIFGKSDFWSGSVNYF